MSLVRQHKLYVQRGSSVVSPFIARLIMKYFVRSFLVLVIALLPGAVLAQTSASLPEEGIGRGGYTIRQSIEVGYRLTDRTGSGSMYDTLVNLQTGPRVLEQSLSMHAQERQGFAFDHFLVNSFGWGGDPNNGLRLRADKSSWYDFRANFRRDQNFFDYNLLVNPLNPSTSSPNMPVLNSAHELRTGRRMTDLDLKLFPLSKVSFRLGYSRNNMSGPSWSSIHEGTDALLYQPWNTTINSYRLGADWKLLPHTVLSYDQTLDYYKGDTAWQLAPLVSGLLANGQGVELGCLLTLSGACHAPLPF